LEHNQSPLCACLVLQPDIVRSEGSGVRTCPAAS
jgi:hypothetical protein